MFETFAAPLARAAIDDRLRKTGFMHPAATAHAARLHIEGRLTKAHRARPLRFTRTRATLSALLTALARRIEPKTKTIPKSKSASGRPATAR